MIHKCVVQLDTNDLDGRQILPAPGDPSKRLQRRRQKEGILDKFHKVRDGSLTIQSNTIDKAIKKEKQTLCLLFCSHLRLDRKHGMLGRQGIRVFIRRERRKHQDIVGVSIAFSPFFLVNLFATTFLATLIQLPFSFLTGILSSTALRFLPTE
ncbi:hypothetical protein BKA57DRAFT_477131 [Linnemannia elongata]|nr:hypothetical protein BKA57DRAFT_477131 [Linnemannia elongata]